MKPACLAGALVLAHSCLAIAQVANLQIKITEGNAAVHSPGSRSAQPLTVQIADDAGRAVAGAAVSFRLPDEGPGALFASGLRTEIAITDANGRATVRHLQFNNTPGEFEIRIVAAKEQSRANTLVRQSIVGTSRTSGRGVTAKSSKKWVVLGVLLAGVAGGVGAGIAARPSTRPAPAAPPPPVTIGPPSVSLGRP